MKPFHLLTLISALFCFFSCKEPILPPETIIPSTNIDINQIEVTFEGGSKTIYLTSTMEWQIEADSSWVTISPNRGEKGDSIPITFTIPKTDSRIDREATATLTLVPTEDVVIPSSTKKTITIKQTHILEIILTPDKVDADSIYIPNELKNNNFYSSKSEWFWGRSRQSKHFIVFWGKKFDEFGDITPSTIRNSDYKVDIDEMLTNAEKYFDYYVNTLGFTSYGIGPSCLDSYKILIMLSYSAEWMAYGSGYDDKTGAIWINSAAGRSNATLAHEIGHSFQYMVYCDQLLSGAANNHKRAFRYNVGEKGCAFWEQTAQWQSYQFYPHTAVGDTYRYTYLDNCHKHFLHEDHRYANSFFLFYIQELHSDKAVGRIWQESVYPEDPIETYMKVFSVDNNTLNTQLYDHASKMALYSFELFAKYSENYIGKYSWTGTQEGDYYKVSAEKCPESTGFNVINVTIPSAGETVTAELEGLPNAEGFGNTLASNKCGWTIGFVAYCSDKTKLFGDSVHITEATSLKGSVSYIVPENCTSLSLVVAATPTEYQTHLWDDDNSNDLHLPYKIKLSNTTLPQ